MISLSDNLKPWDLVLKRLEAAAAGDFIIVLYNPASKARPWQLGEAFRLIAQHRAGSTPVIFAHAVKPAPTSALTSTLADADAAQADMRTLIIIGSSDEARHWQQWTAIRLHAPARGAGRAMSALKPGKRFCDRLDGRRLREYRALDHDHGQRQRTGSFELGGGAGASRFLVTISSIL